MSDVNNNLATRMAMQLQSQQWWKSSDQLYVACSGGIDSVVLVHVLVELGYQPVLLHCNFQLRGEESARDEDFVRSIAQQLNLDVHLKKFDIPNAMKELGRGVQETARILRYEWFDTFLQASTEKKGYLLTAHHRDDQVEGLMMNFFRGTGLAGMKGMSAKRHNIIRPLLSFSREEIIQYAHQHGILWVDDSSNAESKYTRNLFRNELIPQISKVFPSFQDNLIYNAKRFAEIEVVYRREIDRLKKKLLQSSLNGWKIPVNLIKNIQPLDTILFEIFSPLGFSAMQSAEVKKLFDAETGRFMVSSTHRVLKNREWLLIEPIDTEVQELILIQEQDTACSFAQHTLIIQHRFKGSPDAEKTHAYIDAENLHYPLILRKCKPGDYFYPLGMKKKKKLSKFMTDIKLSRSEKENQWVIESNKKIVWVVGQRIDERFKITEKTKEVVCFRLYVLGCRFWVVCCLFYILNFDTIQLITYYLEHTTYNLTKAS